MDYNSVAESKTIASTIWNGQSPFPSKVNPRKEIGITQRAWWDCLLQMHEPAVVRTAAEMRIVGGSYALLSPSGGHTFGSTAVEVVTNLDTATREWVPFRQKLADTDPVTKKRLKGRPHWAKQWTFLTLPNETDLSLARGGKRLVSHGGV
jgi:hypothetical protein